MIKMWKIELITPISKRDFSNIPKFYSFFEIIYIMRYMLNDFNGDLHITCRRENLCLVYLVSMFLRIHLVNSFPDCNGRDKQIIAEILLPISESPSGILIILRGFWNAERLSGILCSNLSACESGKFHSLRRD